MRIISNYKDYYDYLSKYDTDFETIFIRNQPDESIKIDRIDKIKNKYICSFPHNLEYSDVYIEFYLICICDNLYPLVKLFYYKNKKTVLVYSSNECKKLLNSKSYRAIDKLFDFELDKNNLNLLKKLKEQYGPIFILTNAKYHNGKLDIYVNPSLDSYGLSSILHPSFIYNELVKYHCNKSRPEKPIPKMDNDTKIELAGFNRKTSFRKPKQK